ncbi:MAG TPA: hypothetical protein QGH03_02525, partial [Candidatus Paceibacterota bacterium]|nr:hypothetical protein [Candidatus Paceibacterota bacterium]HJN63073.1 hypothetical protein [Candidatus Paceibacterota bacterium]
VMIIKHLRRITAGPSWEELINALRFRGEKRGVSFVITSEPYRQGFWLKEFKKITDQIARVTIKVLVNGIKIQDERGNDLLLDLYDPHSNLGGSQYLEGYFNTLSCEGWIHPQSDSKRRL